MNDQQQRPPMTMILCYRGRRRSCERVTVQTCPDCGDLVELSSKVAHQCVLSFDEE